MKCPICEGLDVIKKGFNKSINFRVQKYKCLPCKKYFSYHDRIPNSHTNIKLISQCLDLYVQGLSYRVIAQQVKDNFDIKVTPNAIHSWIQNYSALIMKYVYTLNPQLSGVWQMDETFIRFKDKIEYSKMTKQQGRYCWVCIDTLTRYVLDMYLAKHKNLNQGMIFFKRIESTIKSKPKVITTDGNASYIQCIRKVYPETSHINLKKISLKPNTSFIERFNGTIKNRTKTMRGFGGFKPCQNTLSIFQVYYNFLRPHMTLDGRTPAQVAGIDLEFPERWGSLIKYALKEFPNFDSEEPLHKFKEIVVKIKIE